MKRLMGWFTRRGCGCVLLVLAILACAGFALYGAAQLVERLLNTMPH
ncbi:MAG: hypothetical protein M1546_00735 [Chloroflexi bacterium]|nr:hypothetical protein [Chloroflexota bacterium]